MASLDAWFAHAEKVEARAASPDALPEWYKERPAKDCGHFPEHIRPYLETFARAYNWRVPGPKARDYKLWVKIGEELRQACGEHGPVLIVEEFEDWNDKLRNPKEKAYDVGGPQSIVRMLDQRAALKGMGRPDKIDGMTDVERRRKYMGGWFD